MPDPKIKKTRKPVKKAPPVRKGFKKPSTPLQKLAVKSANSSAKIIKNSKDVKKVLTPEQKSKLLGLKKSEERKRISAGKPRIKAISKRKELSPGEKERASRVSRRLAVKARIKRNKK